MLSVVNFNILLQGIVLMLLTVLVLGLLLKKFNQPYFVSYIIAGILLGPRCLEIFTNHDTIAAIGELGLLIQMFFIGTKTEVQSLLKNVGKPIIGVIVQIILSFLLMLLLGKLEDWNWKEVLVFTFIISLSSSAIILDYLEKNKELNQPLGSLTSGILIFQDFLLIPMLLTINFISNKSIGVGPVILIVIVGFLIILLLKEVFLNKQITIPFPNYLQDDHEAQVFAGLLICFGFALLTQMAGLSTAIGALSGGVLISQSNTMGWLENNLKPFRVFFMTFFFLSIGLQLNVDFLVHHSGLIVVIVSMIMLVNSLINAFVFRLLNVSWRNSLYAGALLSQIGEFSLVLCMVARSNQLVNDYWFQLTLAVISCTMLISAIWINIIRKFIYRPATNQQQVKHCNENIAD